MAAEPWSCVLDDPLQRSRAARAPDATPLCVDLDGTLIRSDVMFESLLALARQRPILLLMCPVWLLRGRAYFKQQLARYARIDVSRLPYDPQVRKWLEAQTGRVHILCTAADRSLAEAVASHTGGFGEVLASDGMHNLSGRRKAALLVERFGERGFDYAGNEARDLAVWRHARAACVVNASPRLADRVARTCPVTNVIPRHPAGRARAWLQAVRPHQWLKNVLVFVPALAAHAVLQPAVMVRSLAAFAIFCVCASSVYLLNDLLDLDADRAHPRKRHRPFAAGRLPLSGGLVAAPILALLAFAGAYALSTRFAAVLLAYFALTVAYSLRLKQLVIVDVVVLAALYTLRIIAGTVAAGLGHSFWLLAFSMFLFLSLALVKRYTEVQVQRETGTPRIRGRGYEAGDYELLAGLGTASGYLSVLVLALYINSTASAALYHRPQLLWLLCPILLYWISRVWLIAHRGRMHDDPVVFAARDRVSVGVLALSALTVLLAIW